MPPPDDLEVARELGELSALLRSTVERLDRRDADIVRITADQQAQLHEVKHDMRQQSQIMVAFDERLKAHTEMDERNNNIILSEIRENRDRTANVFRETADKISRYREEIGKDFTGHQESIKADITEIKDVANESKLKLEDLLSWRNKILGALALVGIVFAIFGRNLVDWLLKKLGF